MSWLLWLLACQLESTTSQTTIHRTQLTVEQVDELTVRMRDDWTIPKTTLLPQVEHSNPVVLEAERLFQASQGMEAAKMLLELIERDPELVSAHSLLSAVMTQLGDLEQATAAAQKVVELSPSAWSYCNLGTIYVLAASFEEGKRAFERALKLDAKYFLALRNLASIAYQEKRYADAEAYFRQFIRIDPEDTYSYVAYGQVLAEQGKLDAAKEVYLYRLQELEWDGESRRRTPSGLTLDLPLALAEVYKRQGQYEEAIRWFLQTIEWSWVYEGYWTSEESYADQAYTRLIKLIQSLPGEQRQQRVTELMTWFEGKQQTIPVLKQDVEREKFTQWIQVLRR